MLAESFKFERSADFPVIQPTKYELVKPQDRKSALPDELLALADEVIE
jgi:hypothetical protein